MNLITQDASKTGKGIRTIALRLTGTKEAAEELEEMGEDTSDMIMSQSKMRDLIMNATKVASNNYQGFDIQDELGRYKSTYEIMLGLAQIWDEIQQADFRTGDNRQNLLLESIAGKNRASIAASILQNPETLQSVYEDSSTKAAGSAMEENQKYMESISGHLAKLKNAWQEMWANAANRDTINMFIDLGTTILNLINNVGGLQVAFAALFTGTIIKGLFNANSLLVKYVKLLNDSRSASEILTSSFTKTDKDGNPVSRFAGWKEIKKTVAPSTENAGKIASTNAETEALEKLNEAKRENAEASTIEAEANQQAAIASENKTIATEEETEADVTDTGTNTAQVVSEEAVDKAKQEGVVTNEALTASQEQETASQIKDIGVDGQQTGSQLALNGVKASGGAGMLGTFGSMIASPFFWIPAAIIALTTIHGIIKRNNQELIDGGKEAASAWNDTEQSLSSYTQKYTDLTTQLQNQNLSDAEQLDIKKQIFDLQQQISGEYGKEAEGINLVNGNLDDQLEKIKNIQKEEAKRNYQDNTKEYDNAIKKMSGTVSHGLFGIDKGYVLTLDLDYEYEDLNDKLIEDAKKAGFNARKTDDGTQAIFTLKENAEDSDKALHSLSDSISEVRDEVGKKWDDSYFESFNDQLSDAKKSNDEFLQNFQETAYTGLKNKLADSSNSEGWDLLQEYGEGLKNYNSALLHQDDAQIETTRANWNSLIDKKEEYLSKGNNAEYAPLFNQIDEELNKSLQDSYDLRKEMHAPEKQSLIESTFGTLQKNKKVSKDLRRQVLNTATEVLEEWKEASASGKKIDLGSDAMLRLAKASDNANLPLERVINSLKSTGGISALQQMLDGTRISAEEIEAALYDTDSAIAQLANEQFDIRIGETPDDQLKAFATEFASMVGAVSESANESSDSLDNYFKDTSSKIERITSLTSTLQKGQSQTGLTFTKTEENGEQVASEVKSIIDAYKNLEGYDLGSLFEETATGIKLNYDAYRALAQEEEAETKRQYMLKRAALENQLATATGAEKANLQKQITELDMLSSAYDGATSALQKYLNQQNAADYGDTYAMLRDTTIKRADELMNQGMVGTEEFRSIAQLFSNKSLATTSASENVDAYLAGYEKVKKFFTEDNFTGMKTFADELTTLDEKFGTFTKETVDGEDIYKFSASDDQLALLAEHYGVSVDLIEALFDQLRGMGFNLHLYRDGGFDDFKKLDASIEESQNALKELKKTANDPNLIPDSLFDFNASDLDTPEELRKQITELENTKTSLPLNSDAYKEAQKIIDDLKEKLKELEENDEYSPKVTVDGYKQANTIVEQFKETEKTVKEMAADDINFNIEAAIKEDPEIAKFIEQTKQLPPALQTKVMADLDIVGFNPETDQNKIGDYICQALATDEPVVIRTQPELNLDNGLGLGFLGTNGLTIPVNGDTTPLEQDLGVPFAATAAVKADTTQAGQDISELGQEVPAPVIKPETDKTQAENDLTNLNDKIIHPKILPSIDPESEIGTKNILSNLGDGIKSLIGVGVDPASLESAKQETENGIASAEPKVKVPKPDDFVWQGVSNGEIHINLEADPSGAQETIENVRKEAEEPTETPLQFVPKNSVQEAANQAGAQQGVTTTSTETKVTNEETHAVVTTDTSQLDAMNQKMQSVQAMNGSSVSIGMDVSGSENIETAKTNVDELVQKDGSKVTVSVNGNASIFNKIYAQINSALTTLAAKKTEPKITADNSNLKSKVSDSKEKLNSIKDKPVKITASQSGFSTISNWKNSVYDHLGNKDIYIRTHYSSTGTQPKSPFQGSAHNQGTIISKGHAYASGTLSGDWGLPKAEKGALVNELGEEVIVTPDGHWQILNGGDPTFANLPKGSIIFNHKQSESLLKKGYINGSHGKMVGGAFANGTVDEDEDINEDELFEETAGNAFAAGTAKWNGQLSGTSHATSGGGSFKAAKKASSKSSGSSKSSSSSKKKSSGSGKKSSGKSSSSNKNAKDFLQTLDGIEIRLNRIDTLIAQLDANAGKTYSTFAQRSQALASDLSTVTTEINAINASLNGTSASTNYLLKAAQAAQQAGLKSGDEGYKKGAANNVGKALSQDWINRIQNSVNSGTYMTINDVKDEGLWKKIQAYQTWYEKYINLQKKKQEQVNKLSQLTIQQLQLIQTQWDTILNSISADITNNQNQIDLALEKGYDASEQFYNNQITLNKSRLTDLNQEVTELQNKLNSAVSSGLIQKGSEEWYKWQTQIANVRNEIINTNKEIVRLANEIRQIRWDKFERGQESLSDLAEELEFLNGLIYENDQFTKEGVITDKGRASMGLIAMQYDEYAKQAEQYKNEVLKLNAEIAKDPNNNKLIEQRNEWLKAQQTAIENTRKQKEAMADLIENGIKKQIDAMNELIDKYEDALDAEKDQQKYAEDIADRQKKINSLQKQLRAMENDDSEEGRSRRQKIKDELKDAQKDLKDSQEDQRLSDIKDTLSDMQEKYEETLNARLDNIDALFAESITSVNQNGAIITNMINAVGNSVNYNLSAILSAIVNNSGVTNNASDNSSQALVSGTNDTNGKINNTQAATIKSTPTPVVPNPESVATSSFATTTTTTVNKPATTTTTTKPVTTTTTTAKAPTVKNGFVDEGGQTYYYKNNVKQTGWQTINGKKFYFSVKDGHMLTGVQKIGNKYHLLYESTTSTHRKGQESESANLLYTYNGHMYYFKKGEMQTGWHNMKEGRRYFSVKNGQMLTGLQKIGNHSYYLDPKTGVAKTGTFKISGNTYVADKDGKITKKNGKAVKGALAKGKANVLRSGMYRVDEQGEEVFINKQGKIYTRLNKGTTVLPHDAAVNLLKGMSNPTEFIMSHMDMRPNKNITTTNNNTNGDTVNYITFKMDGVTNYTEFMREAQKDPNFTKYIQEISIGKLNGNNSLKGNSIRFR